MNRMLLLLPDRGGNLAPVLVLAVLAADILSLLLLPLALYAQGPRLKNFGARVYGFLAIMSFILGIMLVPVSIFAVVTAAMVRFGGGGIQQSLAAFLLGCAAWLAAPLVFIALGRVQVWVSRRLDPDLWDKRKRAAARRRAASGL